MENVQKIFLNSWAIYIEFVHYQMWKWRQKVKEVGEIDRKDPKDRTEIEIEANEASHQGHLRMGEEFYLDQDYNLITYLLIIIIIIWFGDTVTVSHSTKCDTNSKVRALSWVC